MILCDVLHIAYEVSVSQVTHPHTHARMHVCTQIHAHVHTHAGVHTHSCIGCTALYTHDNQYSTTPAVFPQR